MEKKETQNTTIEKAAILESCPDRADLVALSRGLLASDRLDAVVRHLESCSHCQTQLAADQQLPDQLIDCLRGSPIEESFRRGADYQQFEARAKALPLDSLAAESAGLPPERRLPPEAGELPVQFGQYVLKRRLPGGGMGIVYEAEHAKLMARVAVKVLRAERLRDPSALARFEREMAAIGVLDHSNVVRARDAGDFEIGAYLAMDYVEGLNLSEVVKRRGPLSVVDACSVIRQAADGLQYIHEHGRVHRDIKPSNLMLTPQGQVKILDLGLALLLYGERFEESALTASGQLMGTADYMAPEQASNPHDVTIRADIYSLGCTLYKLLSGHAPFSLSGHSTIMQKMWAHAHEEPPPLQTVRPDIPAELLAVLACMLAKDPAKRFAEPVEVAQAMQEFCADGQHRPKPTGIVPVIDKGATGDTLPIPHREATTSFRSTQTNPQPARLAEDLETARSGQFRRASLVFVPLLAALALAGVYYAFLRPDRPQEPPGPGANADPAATKSVDQPPWPSDYPKELRDRTLGQRIDLVGPTQYRDMPKDPARGTVWPTPSTTKQDLRYQPMWCRRLAGTGQYHVHPTYLNLTSSYPEFNRGATLLALDDDLAMRWFELEADLRPVLSTPPQARCGIFFGWRAEVDAAVNAYFVHFEELKVTKGEPRKGRLAVFPVTFPPGDPISDGKTLNAAFAAKPLGVTSFTILRDSHQIHVVALPERVTVGVNQDRPFTFRPSRDPRGKLGLWVQEGKTNIGRVAVTALPVPSPP